MGDRRGAPARAATVSLFASSLFVGSAGGTFVGGYLVSAGGSPLLFVVLLVAAVPLVAAAWAGRARYP